MKYTWTADMSVGVEAIDEDHKKLISIFNEVIRTRMGGGKREALRRALEELIDYTQVHFSREETMMENNNFPDLAEHRQEHAYFIDKVSELKKEFDAGDSVTMRIDIVLFLNDWLMKHIETSDRRYKPYVTNPEAQETLAS